MGDWNQCFERGGWARGGRNQFLGAMSHLGEVGFVVGN